MTSRRVGRCRTGDRRLRLFLLVALPSLLLPADSSDAGPLPGLPPLTRFFDSAWVRDDGLILEPGNGRWERLQIEPVTPVSGPSLRFEEWRWILSEDGFRGRAEHRAEAWLGLAELDLGTSRVRASRQFGGRLHLTPFTGYQASSQRMIRAEYQLGAGLQLRSEARERGESRIVFEGEQGFR